MARSPDASDSNMQAVRLGASLSSWGRLAEDVPLENFERAPAPGKWNARQHLAHIARHQKVFLDRMRRIVEEKNAEITRYLAEEDPEWPAWECMPVRSALQHLRTGRKELIDFLLKLSPTQLGRFGNHPLFGAMNIVEWVDFYAAHEGHHFYEASELARAKEAGR